VPFARFDVPNETRQLLIRRSLAVASVPVSVLMGRDESKASVLSIPKGQNDGDE
jgi:hypothetical protein